MLCRLIILLVATFIFHTTGLYGQSASWNLKGQVVGESEKQLAFATVTLIDKDSKEVHKVTADSNGRFAFSYNVQGSYALAVTHTGYKAYRSEAFQLSNKDFGTIRLSNAAQSLDEVVVRSKQNLVEMDAGTITYNVAKSMDAQGISALEALRKAPGVYVDDNGISLNGKQGVMILLDGKQTYLSSKEITDLLKSMPASSIRSFEIITNPTAKYDAAGSAGIINIKTNKSQVKGLNGTTTTGVSYGIKARQNQDISFNYRKNSYNVFGSYNHFFGNYNYVYGSDRVQNGKAYASATDDIDKRQRMNARLGVDYNIDKKNTIGILASGNFIFGGGLTRTRTVIGPPGSQAIEQVLTAENDYYFQRTDRYNVNLNYRYEDASGKMINLDADYGFFKKNNSNLQSNIYTDGQDQVMSRNLYRSLNGIDINLKALKFDYTVPIWKGTFEAGAKYSDVRSDNNARFFHVTKNKDSLDDRRSNVFGFNEQIASGYVNYKKARGQWTFQAGLRMEHTFSDGLLFFKSNSADSIERTKRNYVNLFPSFSISVKHKKDHNFSISYARRIDRPAYQDLNPFVYLLDELSFWQGNPFLRPQLTHRASLQYVYKSSTIAGIHFAYSDDFSTRITDTLDAIKIVMIPRNLGVQKNISLSLTQNISPAKWWEVTFNGTLYHISNKMAFDEYRNFNLKQLAGRMSLQQRFKLPFGFAAEVSGYFNSRRLNGANEVFVPNSQVDAGLQRSFLKNKAIIRLVVNDIFKGNRFDSRQNFEGFSLSNYAYYETRQVRLNFTYKFADASVKGPRTRNSALENENGRIK